MKTNVLLTPMFLSDGFTKKIIDDDTTIIIKDTLGRRISIGHWYNDNTLDVIVSRDYYVRDFLSTDSDGKKHLLMIVEHR